jgi:hypothetical protein
MTYADLSWKAAANAVMLHDLAGRYRQLVRDADNQQTIEALETLAADADARAAQIEGGGIQLPWQLGAS